MRRFSADCQARILYRDGTYRYFALSSKGRSMKSEVLIVTQCFYPDAGGIESFITGLADQCALAGHTVTVIAERIRRSPPAPPQPKPYPVLRFGGPRPWRRWRKRAAIASILRERGSQIAGIFADSWKSMEALPSGLTVPVSVFAYAMEYPLNASPAKTRRISAALAQAAAVLPISAYTAGLVLPYLGGQAGKMQTILPPCPELAQPTPDALAAVRHRIGAGRPVIATLARLEPRKGVDAVIRAMPEILNGYPRCVYAVAGGGADRPRLEALATSLGVKDAVVFLGRVSDAEKAALMASADVFAMPVRREGRSVEGFGLTYLEAAWFGVPSLAGRDGGAADAVLDGKTGLVCDGADQSDVTRSLLSLLGDAALRKKLGAAARERVRRELTWPVTIQRYLESFAMAAKRP
jgi:phosphatidylinositol alpha-1,6-mannosyltransferase